MLQVYLAGPITRDGTPDWRARFRAHVHDTLEEMGEAEAIEPWLVLMEPGADLPSATMLSEDPEEQVDVYVTSDLLAIEQADLVVAYLCAPDDEEAGGSKGIGTSFEIGYALGKGKRVAVVISEDFEPLAEDAHWYWRFPVGAMTHVHPSLQHAAAMVAYAARTSEGRARRGLRVGG